MKLQISIILININVLKLNKFPSTLIYRFNHCRLKINYIGGFCISVHLMTISVCLRVIKKWRAYGNACYRNECFRTITLRFMNISEAMCAIQCEYKHDKRHEKQCLYKLTHFLRYSCPLFCWIFCHNLKTNDANTFSL